MSLPAGFENRTEKEWKSLASDTDAAKRKQVTDLLRALGLSAPDYMPWSPDQRVAYIMEKQGAEAAAKSEPKAATGKASKTEGGAGGGGGGMTDADRALLKSAIETGESNAVLLRKVHDLLVVQIFSAPEVKANAEDMDIKVELLGNA